MSSPPSSVFDLRPAMEPALPDLSEDASKKGENKEMAVRQQRGRHRKNKYYEQRRVGQAARTRDRKPVLSGARAVLPARVSAGLRDDYKLVKSMTLLTTTIKDGFTVGFAFRDTDFVQDEQAESLCVALQLQGSHARDVSRIQAFALALVRTCKTFRDMYLVSEDDNGAFFDVVRGSIHGKGIKGGGLSRRDLSIKSVTSVVCKIMLALFINGRKAYLRNLVESMEKQEGVYTNKMADVIHVVDYWIGFTEGEDLGEGELVNALGEARLED